MFFFVLNCSYLCKNNGTPTKNGKLTLILCFHLSTCKALCLCFGYESHTKNTEPLFLEAYLFFFKLKIKNQSRKKISALGLKPQLVL